DGVADTIRPRLDAAGADCTRIHHVQSVKTGTSGERSFQLDQDIETLDRLLSEYPETKAVVIDPVSEYLGRVDSHNNADVRGVLSPLSNLAERHGVAILNVTHFRKGGSGDSGPAMYKAMGSLAFTAQ